MATAFFNHSGPAELVVQILASCVSGSDVLALTSTCKHMRSIWLACAPGVIWRVWPREIPCFDEALVAARATQLVSDAVSRGESPPKDIQPAELGCGTRLPGIAELQAVHSINHFAHALEVAFLHDRSLQTVMEEAPDRQAEWSGRVCKAICRTLVVGATLAGAYTEPFVTARESTDNSLAQLCVEEELSSGEYDFLESFAPYSMEATPEAEQSAFGPASEWLVNNILSDHHLRQAHALRFEQEIGRAQCCRRVAMRTGIAGDEGDETLDCPLDTAHEWAHSDLHLIVWQVMQMVWAWHHIQDSIQRRKDYDADGDDGETRPENQHLAAQSKKVRMVLFGSFQLDEVHMPSVIDVTREPILTIHDMPLNASDGQSGLLPQEDPEDHHALCSPGLKRLPIVRLLERIHKTSGRPNHFSESENPVPPLVFRFFGYILRQYIKARFVDQAFPSDLDPQDGEEFEKFLHHSGIFAHDDVKGRTAWYNELIDGDFLDGTEILWSCEPPPELFYQEIQE